MGRFFDQEDCLKRRDAEWLLAHRAEKENDPKKKKEHIQKAKLWQQRQIEGGWQEEENQ